MHTARTSSNGSESSRAQMRVVRDLDSENELVEILKGTESGADDDSDDDKGVPKGESGGAGPSVRST